MNIPNDVDERGKDMCEQPDNRNDGDKKNYQTAVPHPHTCMKNNTNKKRQKFTNHNIQNKLNRKKFKFCSIKSEKTNTFPQIMF